MRGGIEDPFPGPRRLGTGVLRRRVLFSRHGSNYKLTVFRDERQDSKLLPRNRNSERIPSRYGRCRSNASRLSWPVLPHRDNKLIGTAYAAIDA